MKHVSVRRNGRLAGSQRPCIYSMNGSVSWRLCTHDYRCVSCEFAQMMDDRVNPLELQPLRREEWESKAREDELQKILTEQHPATV